MLISLLCSLSLHVNAQSHQDHGMVLRHENVPVRHTVRVHAHIAYCGTVGRHCLLRDSDFFHVDHQHFLQKGLNPM